MLGYAIATGLIFGLYFALVGVGMNWSFGVMRIVNLAHGDFLMLGAFAAFWLLRSVSLGPVPTIIVTFVMFFVIGLPIYYALVPRLFASREPEMLSLILFFGLSRPSRPAPRWRSATANDRSPAACSAAIPCRCWGRRCRSPGPMPPRSRSWRCWASISTSTAPGWAGRRAPIMAQREEAVVVGIDVHRVSAIAFGIGSGLAAVAGRVRAVHVGQLHAVDRHSGRSRLLRGRRGRVARQPVGDGAGGLIYGVSLMLMRTYLSSFSDMLPNLILIAVLLIRPTGLLGRRVRHA